MSKFSVQRGIQKRYTLLTDTRSYLGTRYKRKSGMHYRLRLPSPMRTRCLRADGSYQIKTPPLVRIAATNLFLLLMKVSAHTDDSQQWGILEMCLVNLMRSVYALDAPSLVFQNSRLFMQLHMANPHRGLETSGLRQRPIAATSTPLVTGTSRPPASTVVAVEAIEMTPRSEPTA